ncbi:hypothetical protein ACQCN2_15035 [Brevibacillus ginsengisoli]|uniref:hypothetical protein n=1 Tax=Brevibacillus ginsengisoli TaxID=363854 RepID=UPI003CEB819D
MNMMMGGQIMFIVVLLFYGFVLYCLITALQFMKTKLELDKERNAKLNQLIQAINNNHSEANRPD